MATTENMILKGMSGALFHQIVVKQYGNKTVVSKYPDMSKRKLSSKQKRMNKLMAAANSTAKRTMADETLRQAALARLKVKPNKLYTSLVKEFFSQRVSGEL